MKVGIIGSGEVARALGTGFADRGHEVVLGTREPAKLADWAAAHPGARVAGVAEAAAHGELVVLAVRGAVAEQVLTGVADEVAGKTVIDTTNPLADAPPDHGVVRFFTDLDGSLMERLQAAVPDARLVKAFNAVGNALMVDPDLPGGPPTMFVCGDDADAKTVVGGVLADFGWDVADLGAAPAARAIEPLCILWCIPGLLEGNWHHALRWLR
jgi:8-hydroxy-5-deazaflavin:NADPH oxidoreductase